ncbi:MAG: hypothetical protein RLZZ146_838, partial [Bacteroidota bacterium]
HHQHRQHRTPSQMTLHPPTTVTQSQQIQSPQPKDKKRPQHGPSQQQLRSQGLGEHHLLRQVTHALPNRTKKLMLLYLIKPHPTAQETIVLHPNGALRNLIQMHPKIIEGEKAPNRIKQKEPDPWSSSFQNAIFPARDHAVKIIQINSMPQLQRTPQLEYKRKSNCDHPPCCSHEKQLAKTYPNG